MARQAQTSTAVLGALAIGPLTGYEIRQAITAVLGHFWHESFGQIYPCLVDLEAAGLITASPGERAGSRRFEITDPGRARLRELLIEPPTPQAPRNGVLLRVFLGNELPEGALDALLADVAALTEFCEGASAAVLAGVLDEISAGVDGLADRLERRAVTQLVDEHPHGAAAHQPDAVAAAVPLVLVPPGAPHHASRRPSPTPPQQPAAAPAAPAAPVVLSRLEQLRQKNEAPKN